MNINSLIMKIENFDKYIVKTGFQRDLKEFIKAIAQPETSQSISSMRDITKKISDHLTKIALSDLPDDLIKLLPREDIKPLKPIVHIQSLDELFDDPEIETDQYHAKLTLELKNLQTIIEENSEEIQSLYKVLEPFYTKELEQPDKGLISLIFKDESTITNLKEFVKVLKRWERTFRLYHQLVNSEPPKDAELVIIQSGTLDVIININFDVALNFMAIVNCGLFVFNGYLANKLMKKDIAKTHLGNPKLIKLAEKMDNEYLENIETSIEKELLNQHKTLKAKNNNIKPDSVEVSVDQVKKTLSEHIVKGNDIKFLIEIPKDEQEDSETNKRRKMLDEIIIQSLEARNQLKELDLKDKQLLIDRYSFKDEDKD